jgi:uncharacterized protein (DUF4213/DUF364 family)
MMHRFADELVAAARAVATALAPPRVARVVLPPPAGPARGGSFCAVELEDGSVGLSYVLLGDTRERLRAAPPLADRDVLELAEGFAGDDPAARCVGLAAVNALTRHALDRAGYVPDFATHSLGSLPLEPGDSLGMIGLFPPLVPRALAQGIQLTVLELKEELVREAPGLTVTLDPARLAGSSVIVCTSSVLLNDSLDAVLAAVRGCREFVIIGPSAGCIPDPLFARGVTSVGGAWVTQPATLLDRLARGEKWGDASRKFALHRDAWPGRAEILRRATLGRGQ